MFTFAFAAAIAAASIDNPCSYDRKSMLALDEEAFDQNLNSGWRVLELKPQCRLIAADLIRDYRNVHRGPMDWILFWHEGQLRAEAGQTRAANDLFDHARRPATQAEWNFYVDGTVAFLKHDRAALISARNALAALPGRENLNVLDGLLKCFRRSYDEAYAPPCTKPFKQIEIPAR
jgi:hypothetical protein